MDIEGKELSHSSESTKQSLTKTLVPKEGITRVLRDKRRVLVGTGALWKLLESQTPDNAIAPSNTDWEEQLDVVVAKSERQNVSKRLKQKDIFFH